jgi:four helix bundle protein
MATSMEELRVLRTAEEIADSIWEQVIHWDVFAKDTVGKQTARAADSIGANIAEAFGRFHFGQKIEFLYYSRGSLFETKYWLNRAAQRNLFPPGTVQELNSQMTGLARQLNAYVKNLKVQQVGGSKAKMAREEGGQYQLGLSEGDFFDKDDLDWLQSPISNL